ncbi:hypothetical protein NMG60_11018569, partial [Bertholletia excelsa]
SKEHRDRDHKHRSSKHKSRDADDDRHHHSEKHRSKDDKHRDYHRSRDDKEDRRRSREYSEEREKSQERRIEKEGSRDRAYDNREKRERSYEPRRERDGSLDGALDGDDRDRSREREGSRDRAHNRTEKRERRKFEDRVKKEDMDVEEEGRGGAFNEEMLKKEAKDEVFGNNQIAAASNGGGSNDSTPIGPLVPINLWQSYLKFAGLRQPNMASKDPPETSLFPSHSLPTKVSSISTTNENKGVSITGSHEVPGKSSTDGSTSAGKSGNFSLDALAKAKRALQMQKELNEKLKKLPLSNKGVSSEGSPLSALKEGPKDSSSTAGLLPTPVNAATLPAAAATSVNHLASGMASSAGLTPTSIEAVKRAQELAAKLGFRQDPQFAPLINMFPGQMPPELTSKPTKAPVLRLDPLGREIDEHGNVVNTTKATNLSTLMVNINKQRKEAFQILKPELDVDPEKNPHFDARMGINTKKLLRPKRTSFQFVEEGKWSKDAEIIKLKNQFGEAQAKELKVKQAQLAKAKAELDINPNLIEVSERVITKEKPKETIPEIEWWDQPFLYSVSYADITDNEIAEDKLKMEKITIYVEHPRPIEPPAEPAPPPPQPLKLTKKEQKKLRTQRRLAREKDRQEMIRQGLLEPPKPKVKMSNLMKVLGSEATQDPTRLEMEIRSAAAEREQAHIDRNIARKLTPDERREKKERKLFDDLNNVETIVSVYKINDLSHPQTRFKVDVNAQENRLTGCAVIADGISVVVVEGGNKAIKRYGKLMLRRIDWASAVKNEEEGEEDGDDEDKPVNKCLLVWQGSVAKATFNRFSVHECRTEAAARKVFSDAGVPHYWDLAVNFAEDQM